MMLCVYGIYTILGLVQFKYLQTGFKVFKRDLMYCLIDKLCFKDYTICITSDFTKQKKVIFPFHNKIKVSKITY